MASLLNVKPLPQTFPYNLMKYITKDPPRKPETQWKLVKMCKFFYAKHPIIPVSKIILYPDSVTFTQIYQNHGAKNYKEKMEFKENKLALAKAKFWITQFMEYNYSSDIMSNVYRFDGNYLELFEGTLKLDDYIKLVASKNLLTIILNQLKVINEDKTLVSAEILLNTLCHLSCISMYA